MIKRVRLTESDLHRIVLESVKRILSEAMNAPVFGSGRFRTDYTPTFKELEGIENLHNDRYKDYALDEAWNNWKKTGFDKGTEDYLLYVSQFKKFMSEFSDNLSYVADRLNGPLHSVILDPKWTQSLINKKNWRYSDLGSNSGGDEFHCFYTTILKIYQNPAIWNDFFFNPAFADMKKKYDSIRAKITAFIKNDREAWEKQYKPLLPLKEYKELNLFMNNKENCKPELFYEPNQENVRIGFDDEEDY